MNYRLRAITEFLNDEPQQVTPNLFLWRNHYYQVLPYKQIRKFGSREDQFVKISYAGKIYGLRELSEAMLKKYYSLDI